MKDSGSGSPRPPGGRGGYESHPAVHRRSGRGVRRAAVAAAALGIAALTLTACDSDITGEASGSRTTVPSLQARASAPTTEHSAEPIPSTTAPAPPAQSPPPSTAGAAEQDSGADSGTSTCRTDGLEVHLGRSGGAAGSIYVPIVLTNTSGGSCVITGFPGVSYVDSAGEQVGSAAVRDDGSGDPVTLAPGDSASAMLRMPEALNYPRETCHPTDVAGLRIYPPNNTAAVVVDHSGTGCATHDPDVVQLAVQSVKPGTGRP